MKKIAVLSIALAAIAMVSCKREEIEDQKGPVVKKTFSATLDHTKAYIGTDRYVYWTSADKVAIYDGICSEANTFTVISGEGTMTAKLSGEVCHGASSFIAVSPASAAKGLADGKVTVTVPSVQTAGANNIDESALVMTSSFTGNSFACKNVNGVFKVSVDVEGIEQIRIRTNDGSALAGTVTVDPAYGTIVESASATSSEVVLNPDGDTFDTGDYYVAVLPVKTTADGITVDAYTSSKLYEKVGTKVLDLKRNDMVSLGGLIKTTPVDMLYAHIAEFTSSTITVDLAPVSLRGAFRLALYEDEACTKLVVAHNIPADKISVTDATHRFVFGGLKQNTTYYYKISNEAGESSSAIAAKTLPFDVKPVPDSAAAGAVVLAEDFSELAFHGTYNSLKAAAWAPFTGYSYQSGFRFTVPSGEQTQYYSNYSEETRLFSTLRDAVPASRLADWAEWVEYNEKGKICSVCPHAGHLKIGAEDYISRIVTPQMKFVPEGKTATLRVTFTGAKLDADTPVVQVVTGSKIQTSSGDGINPYNFMLSGVLDEQPVEVTSDEWSSYTVTVSNVTADSRIAIGTKRVGTNNQRFLISDVTIELVSYETPAPWSGWSDITASYAAENNVALGNIKMYKNTKLEGRVGNVGYVFKVPAGQLDATVVSKYNSKLDGVYDNDKKAITNTMKVYDGYTIYIPFQGPGVWNIDGDGELDYYSPLIYGPDASGVIKVLRGNVGFKGSAKAYSPALGIKAGKAYIEPASTYDQGKVYMYSDITPSGEAEWNVDACISGMFQIVKDGRSLIAGSDDASLNAYNQAWRKYPGMTQKLNHTKTAQPMLQYDKLRNGRVVIGCTAQGDLIILVVEKFVDTFNCGQGTDAGQNGADTDSRGLTMYETAKVMTELGCSDAMTIDDLPWSFVVLRDGSERGKDLFWNYQRCNADGSLKTIDSEWANLWTLCIKANNNVGDLNRNPINW